MKNLQTDNIQGFTAHSPRRIIFKKYLKELFLTTGTLFKNIFTTFILLLLFNFTGYSQIDCSTRDSSESMNYSSLIQSRGVYQPNGGGSGQLPIVNPYPNAADNLVNLDFSEYPEGTYYIYIYDIYGI
ncbi:MAG: hypothetical protein CVU03_10930 [Bacteroidetes bacterium HGW-Bacteroidetes-2]|jgi:hypothetical protein|nr:MAG: hypothetical protein CVU03_10930 [Bacteroidetes bacterium HGW-Bacteroidetes-2]